MRDIELRALWAKDAAKRHAWKVTPMTTPLMTSDSRGFVEGWHESEYQVWLEGYRAGLTAPPPPAQQAVSWQPIETAPRNGSTMLLGLFNQLGKWRTMRGQWMSRAEIDETWEEPEDGEEGFYETCVEAEDVPNCWRIHPTHWMPLPSAPQLPKEQGK